MSRADWTDFVHRLTTKYDAKYVIGALADPGDLLDYFLSIVPRRSAGRMCAMDFKWTTTFPCACRMGRTAEFTDLCEQAITISPDCDAPLHIISSRSLAQRVCMTIAVIGAKLSQVQNAQRQEENSISLFHDFPESI